MQSVILAGLAALFCTALPALGADGDILEREPIPAAPGSAAAIERVIYESDGLRILGYLAYPKDAPTRAERLPCLLFNRGGNRDFGAMTPERFVRLAELAAEWGYVVFASNYRGSAGSEGADEFGGRDVDDVLNALTVFDHLDFADPTRIGMWGHSRGGMMTYIALTRTGRVKAAIIGAGLADMERSLAQRPEMETNVAAECVPDWAERRAEAVEARSAVRWADRLPADVPVLIIHGSADWRVDPRDALDMTGALLEARRPCRLILFEGADHGVSEFRDEYHRAVREWLDAYVAGGRPLPDLEPHGR